MAGKPEFDVAFWRKHTEYKGYRPEDATVEFFWKVATVNSATNNPNIICITTNMVAGFGCDRSKALKMP